MTHDPIVLATKIAEYIKKSQQSHSLEAIQERALSHDIPPRITDQAIQRLRRRKDISAVAAGGTVMFAYKKPKVAKVLSHLVWIRENYPQPSPHCFDANGNFIIPWFDPEKDTRESLMMTREQFKAAQRGSTFIPKKKYFNKSYV